MHIPAWVPRLPPNLASAMVLAGRTRVRRKIRKKRLAKKKTLKGSVGSGLMGAPINLFLPAPEERKHDCTAHLIGRWGLSTPVKLHPGGRIRHNPSHAHQLHRAIALSQRHWVGTALIKPSLWKDECGIAYSPIYPYTAFKYIDALISNVSERGRIHDFSDAQDQWTQIWWFLYKAFVKGLNFVAFPDLRLSNFYKLDIYYRVLSEFIPIEAVEKLRPKAEKVWGRPIFMEEPKGMPGVIRICALPEHRPVARPATAVNGSKTTKFHFGTTILSAELKPIEVDILELAGESHLYCVGQTASGKTNLLKQLCQDATEMINHGIVSQVWFFDPIKNAAGLRRFQARNFQLATDPAQTDVLIGKIRSAVYFRNQKLEVLNLQRKASGLPEMSQWPIGKTINGELYTAKLIIADEFLGFEKETIQIFVEWAQQLRSLGIVMMLFAQDFRANAGVPTALMKNVDARMCLRVRDESIGSDFFKAGKEFKFPREPTKLERGQFILDLPSRHLDLHYGITKHIPDDYQQAA